MSESITLTPKELADEVRATVLLRLIRENPGRSQEQLCELMGIGSRNTLSRIMQSEAFRRMLGELRTGLLDQMTLQLAQGVPEVVDYQMAVASGRIGSNVRDHVTAGRVVRDFLALLLDNQRAQPQLNRQINLYGLKHDPSRFVHVDQDIVEGELVEGAAPEDVDSDMTIE
ncbi:MAG: helix-turn-helix transcriptional regulator [Caldilineales bacterium]|nr:helix-turn-helix transcriptional regulator [Caldilineales bacterium]